MEFFVVIVLCCLRGWYSGWFGWFGTGLGEGKRDWETARRVRVRVVRRLMVDVDDVTMLACLRRVCTLHQERFACFDSHPLSATRARSEMTG